MYHTQYNSCTPWYKLTFFPRGLQRSSQTHLVHVHERQQRCRALAAMSRVSSDVQSQQRCSASAAMSSISSSVQLQQRCRASAAVSSVSNDVGRQQRCRASAAMSSVSSNVGCEPRCRASTLYWLTHCLHHMLQRVQYHINGENVFLNRSVYLDTNVNATSVPSQQHSHTVPVALVIFSTAIWQPSYVNGTWTLFWRLLYCVRRVSVRDQQYWP